MLSRLGDLISLNEEKNRDLNYGVSDVKGISINKVFIETKANLKGVSLRPYIIVKPKYFAYVTVTSRNGDKVSMAFNDTNETYIVSSSYVSFYVKNANILLPEYLYIYFNRPEFDRIARFNSWGSARETFSWEDLCDLEIHVPSIEIQQKYVDIYLAIANNQKSYENGLDDLKLVSNGFIESLKSKFILEPIGNFIKERKEKNGSGTIKRVRGVSSIEKDFIKPKRDINMNSVHNYNVVYPNDLAYRPVVTGYDDSLCIAINKEDKEFVISPIYPVFYVDDRSKLLPEYLFMWLSKDSFDKYAWYHSTGSARETLDFDILSEYKIPVPPIELQKSIVVIHNLFLTRKNINDNLSGLLKNICPVLIKGATQESKGVI
jgi:type I restriction enzyme S subunit